MKFSTVAAFLPFAAQAQYGGGFGGQNLYGFRGGFQPAFGQMGGFGGQNLGYSFNNNFASGLLPQQTLQLHMAGPMLPPQQQTTFAQLPSSPPLPQFSAYGGPSQFTQSYSNLVGFTPQPLGNGAAQGFNGGSPFNMFGGSTAANPNMANLGFRGNNAFGQLTALPPSNQFGNQFGFPQTSLTQFPAISVPPASSGALSPSVPAAPSRPTVPAQPTPTLPVEPKTPALPVATQPPATQPPATQPPATRPPATQPPAPAPLPSIVELGFASPDHTTLVAILSDPKYADILAALNGAGPLTLFAPTNKAFAAAGLTPATFGAAPVDVIKAVLTYHVVGSKLGDNFVVGDNDVTTVNGATLTFVKKADGEVTIPNGSAGNVALFDRRVVRNGIVYVIDALLRPPAPAPAATEAPATEAPKKPKKGRR